MVKIIDLDIMDKVHAYLNHWRDDDSYSDVNLMLDKGLTELAAWRLVNSGAINSEYCYTKFKSIERTIERLVKSYSTRQMEADFLEFWENTECWQNKDGESYFINKDFHLGIDESILEGFRLTKPVVINKRR